ncbi:hypothetical protein RS022_05620 [Candidatus Phytoplasma rubi]|uniref:Uncharacterized protein n=1 Tax=Candidatus Phytoplasma rubi TaxID=399025 RepID=A0ABY7BW09_9MOLU|nr:hypothetical protein [Candidatus Phytoplasma rubi]WAN63426.1 hypothetical protein RS022_05620 [Candidatus Phytoplasma rubi]
MKKKKKKKISKYSKTFLCSFLFFIFIFSFSILFCNFVYGSEEELYEKQKENCINETKQREQELFEMFYDFKEDIAPMLKSLKDLEIRYKQLPEDKRKENFDKFLNFYPKSEIFHLENEICNLDKSIEKEEDNLQVNKSKERLEKLKNLYFDFILNKMNEYNKDEYDSECSNENELYHLTQRDPKNLKRTQLFSYLPEVTNLQFKIEYLRYFYKILKELLEPNNFDIRPQDIYSEKEFLDLINELVVEYNKENESKRQEKLKKFFTDNLEFQYLDNIDIKLKEKSREKLEKGFRENLENRREFLKIMLLSPFPKENNFKKIFSSKTSLYNDNLKSPSLNKKELIEHIIHRNNELINIDLSNNLIKTENDLYKMYVNYSIFVFRSSCLYEKKEQKKLNDIIKNQKKLLFDCYKRNFNEYKDKYEGKLNQLCRYLKHLDKELKYQKQDIDNRYLDPVIDKETQKETDKGSLGIDLKTIYLQNPEDLKNQLQFQLGEINEYISNFVIYYKEEIKTIIEETEDLINFINVLNKNTEINEERKTKIQDKIKSLTEDSLEKNKNIQLLEIFKKKLNEKPHCQTHALKDNLEKLVKTYLTKITDFIDDGNIIDVRIKTYKDYYKFKKENILNPYLDIISELQIKYYKLVIDILGDIEKSNVFDEKKEYYLYLKNEKKYPISTDLDKKNIDDYYQKLQDYLKLNYSSKEEQNFELSLDNIQWIGQFLANYKQKLTDNFNKCNINEISENNSDQIKQIIEIFESEIKQRFQKIQEPTNINADHNNELEQILKKFEESEFNSFFKDVINSRKKNLDSINSQKTKLDSLCEGIIKFVLPKENKNIFKDDMEKLIDIVKQQYEKEKKIREFNIEIKKNEKYFNELDKIIESYSIQNNNEINFLTNEKESKETLEHKQIKEEEIDKQGQETLNSLIIALNEKTKKSLIEEKEDIKKEIENLLKNLKVNKEEHLFFKKKYEEQQKNLNIQCKENFLNLIKDFKDYKYIDTKSFYIKGEFNFIDWLQNFINKKFPKGEFIDDKYIDSQEQKQKQIKQKIKIDTTNYPYFQDAKNYTCYSEYLYKDTIFWVLNIHLNSNENYNWNKIEYKVKFYE